MRLAANLLCETEWARVAASERLVLATSALGTLLGALAREGDTIWTPRPVDAERVSPGPGLPAVALESGPLDALPPAPLLAWGETPATARARPAECAVRPGAVSEHWLDAVRATRAPTAGTHRRVCDRRRQLAFAKRAELSLPHSYTISRFPADTGTTSFTACLVPSSQGFLLFPPEHVFDRGGGPWVAKAPWSAAGRERLRGRGWPPPEQDAVRLARLFDTHGELVVEPWCDRVADFGAIALVVGGTVHRIGFHRAETAGGGAFRGLRPLPEVPVADGMTADEMEALHDAVRAAGAWLLAEGYEGPFGIDAWRWTDDTGQTRFHPFGELNARLTFGFVARRLAEASGWDPAGGSPGPALRVGSAEDLAAAAPTAVLLQPAEPDGVGAWTEA